MSRPRTDPTVVAGRAIDQRQRPIHRAHSLSLTLPLAVGEHTAEIALEPAHVEWLLRVAAYVAIRDGVLDPHEPVAARLVPGELRERHGDLLCLDGCGVELTAADGRILGRSEFGREVFAVFAAARALHLMAEAAPQDAAEDDTAAAVSRTDGASAFGYSLHATLVPAASFPVAVPALARMHVTALCERAAACGTPADDWVATFATPQVAEGLATLEAVSRAGGVEAAARIRSVVGFDPERRCFVRVLERLVLSRQTVATATSVLSLPASWADVLEEDAPSGPRTLTGVHTHLHLREETVGDGAPGDHLLVAGALRADGEPCISIEDIVTHLTHFPDPLAASVIVSLYPERRVVRLYGHTPSGLLRREPGYWQLTKDAVP
jgi:hypothetical protein